MTDSQLASIDLKLSMIQDTLNTKFDKMIKLIGIVAMKGLPLQEQIYVLHGIGFTPSEIASCIGKTPNTVRVLLHRQRHSKGTSEVETK